MCFQTVPSHFFSSVQYEPMKIFFCFLFFKQARKPNSKHNHHWDVSGSYENSHITFDKYCTIILHDEP